jgi:hypothetical protein
MGEMGFAYKSVIQKREGITSLGNPWCRWETNFKMDIKEVNHIRCQYGGFSASAVMWVGLVYGFWAL